MTFKHFVRSLIGIFICSFLSCTSLKAQSVGLSFSYFLPKDGYFSTPISPFSIRGLGVDLNRYFAIQTGVSLYRMSGLNVKDIGDLETKNPILGPNFTALVPLELVLQFRSDVQEFSIKGGGFGFYGFGNKLNYGNLDKAIRKAEQWEVANSDFDFNHGLGLGFFFGAEYVVYVTRQWGLSLEANYFIGDANLKMKGSYWGGPNAGGQYSGPADAKIVDFPESKVDFTGLEISLGILITR
ncbi:MAG: hypothetical protein WD555_02345 [Fulvivirga sp.]